MDAQRAGELLARERARIEQQIASLEREGPLDASDRKVPGDEETEDLYQDEMNLGRAEDLRQQLDSVALAEARLAAGTYGLSIDTGKPIPDERLEVIPTAERTVEEEERRASG